MKFVFNLTENDFLNFQLYYASTDEGTKKLRMKEKYRIIGLSVLCGIILFFDEDYRTFSYFFLGSSVLFLFVYPWWSAWFYKRIYRKQIAETFKGKFPYPMEVSMENDTIGIDSPKGNTSFKTSDIKTIIETKGYFFVMMNQLIYIIIPKIEKSDTENIRKQLGTYEINDQVPFIRNLEW